MDRGLEAMLDALARLSRAGAPPSIGDDDGGRLFDGRRNRSQHMLDPLATGAVLYERGDFKFLAEDLTEETVWLMGEAGVARFDAVKAAPMHSKSAAPAESGLYMMCDARQCWTH